MPRLWFDVNSRRDKTYQAKINSLNKLWFDVNSRRDKT